MYMSSSSIAANRPDAVWQPIYQLIGKKISSLVMEGSNNDNSNKRNKEGDNKTKKKSKKEKNVDPITTTTIIDDSTFSKTATYCTRVKSYSMGITKIRVLLGSAKATKAIF